MKLLAEADGDELKAMCERARAKHSSGCDSDGLVCCDYMAFALRHSIVRHSIVKTDNRPYFGADVMPPQLTKTIVACPWCGKPVTQAK